MQQQQQPPRSLRRSHCRATPRPPLDPSSGRRHSRRIGRIRPSAAAAPGRSGDPAGEDSVGRTQALLPLPPPRPPLSRSLDPPSERGSRGFAWALGGPTDRRWGRDGGEGARSQAPRIRRCAWRSRRARGSEDGRWPGSVVRTRGEDGRRAGGAGIELRAARDDSQEGRSKAVGENVAPKRCPLFSLFSCICRRVGDRRL